MAVKSKLYSNIHFYTALIDKRVVVVHMDDELIGSGLVEQVTEATVKIDGEYYMRSECKFNYVK